MYGKATYEASWTLPNDVKEALSPDTTPSSASAGKGGASRARKLFLIWVLALSAAVSDPSAASRFGSELHCDWTVRIELVLILGWTTHLPLMEAKLSRALNIAESVARVDMLQSRGHVARGAWGARF